MNLNLNDQEVVLVGRALANMPYGEVAVLIGNLQKQINEQTAPTTEVKEDNDSSD